MGSEEKQWLGRVEELLLVAVGGSIAKLR